jgi:GGDEF domain-containing protein
MFAASTLLARYGGEEFLLVLPRGSKELATVVVDRCRARSFFGSGGLINVPEAWPEALRISLRIILTTNHPMLIWWGGENKLQMLI